MKVSCVSSYKFSTNQNKLNKSNINNPNFMHHPDFVSLKEQGYSILASSYFRRGGVYGCASEEFIDVINALKLFFNPDKIQFLKKNKSKMLIAGLGESQEPFSLLTTIKSHIGEEKVSDVLDMYTVDLQSKISKKELFKQSFYNGWEPRFARSGFVPDDGEKYGLPSYKMFRVKDEIFNYLLSVYKDSKKSKWETRIQESIKEYPDKFFDVVSINNTIGYIKKYEEQASTVNNIFRILKSGGIFISDNRIKLYRRIFTTDNSNEIYTGIFQKR